MNDPLDGLTPEPTELDPPDEFVKPNPGVNGRARKTVPRKRGPVGRALLGEPKAPKTEFDRPKLGRRGQFERPLRELYTSIGAIMMPFDPICGTAVIQQAEPCAKSLDELAYQNDSVRHSLEFILATSAWGAVIAAHVPILLAIVMHHSPTLQARMTTGFGDVVENMMRQQNDAGPTE